MSSGGGEEKRSQRPPSPYRFYEDLGAGETAVNGSHVQRTLPSLLCGDTAFFPLVQSMKRVSITLSKGHIFEDRVTIGTSSQPTFSWKVWSIQDTSRRLPQRIIQRGRYGQHPQSQPSP